MGTSGLLPREAARLRTLGLATSARATGIFDGANDFRFAFPGPRDGASRLRGVDADLAGFAVAPSVADLSIAAFGLGANDAVAHRLGGLTHLRLSTTQGMAGSVLRRLATSTGIDLSVVTEDLGFEPQGQGVVRIDAEARASDRSPIDWSVRGGLRDVRLTLGGVRPKADALDRIEGAFKEGLWEARRMEGTIRRLVTEGTDAGVFFQVDMEYDTGGAVFHEVVPRSGSPIPIARRALRRALAFIDGYSVCDDETAIAIISAAAASGRSFTIALTPTERLTRTVALLREIGVAIEESEKPGLVVLSLAERASE